jgi:hypothetical protein
VRFPKPSLHALLCLSLPALLLVGCGSSDNGVSSKSAAEILAASRAAVQSASSVRITSKYRVGPIADTLEGSLAKNGSRARVDVLGSTVEAIRINDTLYIKGNRKFNYHLEQKLGVKVPAGVWLKGPAAGVLSNVGTATDIHVEVLLLLSGNGPVTKGTATTIAGQPAITVKRTQQPQKLYEGTLYIATTGQPYPLKLTKTGKETGQTTFSNWNDPIDVSAPANAVDIRQLERKGH